MRKRSRFDVTRSYDPAERAKDVLDLVMEHGEVPDDVVLLDERLKAVIPVPDDTHGVVTKATQEEIRMSVEDERRDAPLLEYVSERDQVRLLILTRDTTVRELGSLSQRHLLELGQLFAEIHVIILNTKDEETITTVRLAENTWLYSTHSNYWWKTVFDAKRIARTQLVFSNSFRPDIVVAHDPFESGVAGLLIARTFDRSLQVHVHEDFYDTRFVDLERYNDIRAFAAPRVLKRATSVRVKVPHLLQALVETYPLLEKRSEILPEYYDLRAWRDMTPNINLRTRYPQFRFIMLHVSSMYSTSRTAEVIEGAAPILRQYPGIGLVIVGSGPLRGVLEKKVIAFGIQNQVEFEPSPDEHISHMKSAHVLIHFSDMPEEDQVLLEAASVKLPIIARSEGLTGELFSDGESAFLCAKCDPYCITEKINTCLNQNQLRVQYAIRAQEIVFDRIQQDYRAYLEAYRSSILRTIG